MNTRRLCLCAALALASSGSAHAELGLVPAPGALITTPSGVGRALDLEGTQLAVGDTSASSAYVYELVGGAWVQTGTATGPSAEGFGLSVAIDGDSLVVGGGGFMDEVRIWIFERSGGTWSEVFDTTLNTSENFGTGTVDVDISGDRVLAGASLNMDLSDRGQARVYERTGTGWQLEQTLLAFDSAEQDLFGCAVALDGDTLLVGAYGDDPAGSVYAYVFNGVSWGLQQKLAHPTLTPSSFGWSVALDGERAAIGAYADPLNGILSGTAHVFTRSGTTWSATQQLVPADIQAGDGFGRHVAIEAGRLVVGSTFADGNVGAAYLYAWDGSAFCEEARLGRPGPPAASGADNYGEEVGVGADHVVVGGGFDVAMDAGGAYSFAIASAPSFCDASDGALASCPCANPGAPDAGCDNAQATGGVKAEFSSLDLGGLAGTLVATGYPSMSSPAAIVIRATNIEASPVVFFDGLRCIGLANFTRLSAAFASGGVSTHPLSHGAGPGAHHYQVWYRNTPVMFCDPAAAANVSNGRTVVW